MEHWASGSGLSRPSGGKVCKLQVGPDWAGDAGSIPFALLESFANRRILGGNMLYWAAMFLVIALIAAFLGFAGVATAAAGIAKILFYIFLVIFRVTLIMGLGRRGTRA